MATNDESSKPGLIPTRPLVMVVVLVVLGLAVGYVVRGSRGAKSGVPVAVSNAQPAGSAANAPSAPGELKRMADEESKPILKKLESNPKDPALLAQLGDLRFDAGQYKDAITYYEQSLALDAKNTRVRADMANAYAYSGNPDRAISEYQNALKYDPKHGLSLLNLRLVQWHDKHDVKSAVEAWEKLAKVNPQFAEQVGVAKLIATAKQHAVMPTQKSEAK